MKQGIAISVTLLAVFGFLGFYLVTRTPMQKSIIPEVPAITVASPAFAAGQAIPPRFTCDGEDVSPPLSLSGVPKGAKTLVFIMNDPDAPGGTWDHWVIFNLDASISDIPEGFSAGPAGAIAARPFRSGLNSWGKTGYGGPCPPRGEHRYFFKVYALDTELLIPEGIVKKEIEKAIEGHILAYGELVGVYQRIKQ